MSNVRQMVCLPAQRQLIESTEMITLFVGGLGSGKTRAAVYKALTLGFKNAPCVGMFVEPSYVLTSDVAVPSFKQVCDELGIPYTYRKNDHVFSVANRFEILMRSGDQPERMVGSNIGWGIVDEPGVVSEDVAKKVLARIRDPRAKQRQLVLVGTPEGKNWFYEWSKDPNHKVIRAKTTDNAFLPPEYVNGLLERFTPEEIQSYIMGEFISFDGAFFRLMPDVTPHDMVLNVVRQFKKPEHCSTQLVIGVDTGGGLGRDGSAFAMIDKRDSTLVCSWKDNKASIDDMCVLIRDLIPMYTPTTPVPLLTQLPNQLGRVPQVVVEANGIGRATIQVLQKMKVSCVEQNTTDAIRYDNLNHTRNRVNDGTLKGPPELREEAELLVTKNGKFDGPKDLAMALGFAYRHAAANPYVKPADPRDAKVFSMRNRLGKKKGSGQW